MEIYSVSFRLQRILIDYSYVSIPVTPDLILIQDDGSSRINVSKMLELAVSLGNSQDTVWHLEEKTIQLHPVQQVPDGK